MAKNIEYKQERIRSFYKKFKTDDKLMKSLNERNAVVATDEKRDEVYYSDESHYEVSTKGRFVDGLGDVLYGLRIRLKDDNGIRRIKTILSEEGHDPNLVITDVSERMDYTEVTIEFSDILEIMDV